MVKLCLLLQLWEWLAYYSVTKCGTEILPSVKKKKYVYLLGLSNLYALIFLFLFLCHLGVEAKFGVTVGKMNWIHDRSSWSLIGLDGKELGHFDGVVASDKNLVSPRFSEVHGVPPPLGPFILSFFQQYCKYSLHYFKILSRQP